MTGESLFICCLSGGGKVSHHIDWTPAAGRKERPSLRLGRLSCPVARYLGLIIRISHDSGQRARPAQVDDSFLFTGRVCSQLKECRDCEKGRVAVDVAALEIKIQFVILSLINIILLILSTQC